MAHRTMQLQQRQQRSEAVFVLSYRMLHPPALGLDTLRWLHNNNQL